MHYLYGVVEGNALKAERLYRERFPTEDISLAKCL
jgi:hypothetical protein